jgi:hypothetical protein
VTELVGQGTQLSGVFPAVLQHITQQDLYPGAIRWSPVGVRVGMTMGMAMFMLMGPLIRRFVTVMMVIFVHNLYSFWFRSMNKHHDTS